MKSKKIVSKADTVRVGGTVGRELSDWFTAESEKTGIPKSTLIQISMQQYKQQSQALSMTELLKDLVDKVNHLYQEKNDDK